MHHKHKRTVRKEVKRYDHKTARAKTKAALEGGSPGQARGMSWSNTLPQPPIVDEVGKYKNVTKKTSPKKDKCPCNDRHEWYKEWLIEDVNFIDSRYSWKAHMYRWTCIHCWKTKVVKRQSLRSYPRYSGIVKTRTAYRRPR